MHPVTPAARRVEDGLAAPTTGVDQRRGWHVVAAAFVVAIFGWGIGFYGPPVYLEAVHEARGWPLALISGAVTVHFLSGVFVIANLPRLHHRYGLPAVTIIGASLLAIGVLGWASARTPMQLYAAALLSGASWPTMGAAAINAIVSPWFVARRPAALSMAYNGASIGGVIFSPLLTVLIAAIGFPAAATLVGAIMVVVIVVFSISVLSWTPAIRDQIPDGSMATAAPREVNLPSLTKRRRQLRDSRSFVTLSLGMTLALFAQIGLIAHFVSLLAPDLGARGAGLAAGLSSVAAILGRLIVGWLLPARADRRLIACGCLLIQIAGCVMLTIASDGNASGLLVGVILIGLGVGNATSLPPLIAQAEFDRADVARVVALTVAISQAGYAFAPFVFGTLRELGSDGLLYLTAAAVQLGSVMAYLAGRTTGCCGTSATMPPATPSAIRPR